MLKKLLLLLTFFYAAMSFAAVDVNQASAAELDSIKGIGPAISGKILDERKKGAFKDWNDFISRVNGLGQKNAAKFSAQGMTINGAAYSGAPATEPKAADKKAAGKLAADSKAAAPAVPPAVEGAVKK
jgi:competence protein ComEA